MEEGGSETLEFIWLRADPFEGREGWEWSLGVGFLPLEKMILLSWWHFLRCLHCKRSVVGSFCAVVLVGVVCESGESLGTGQTWHHPRGGGLRREAGYQRNRLKWILQVNFYLKESKCPSQIGTDDLGMAVFRNHVEVATDGLISQHSGAGCLTLESWGEGCG